MQLPYVGIPGRFIQYDEVLTGDAIPLPAVLPLRIQHQSRRNPQHVFPIDPGRTEREPELRLLLGLLTC